MQQQQQQQATTANDHNKRKQLTTANDILGLPNFAIVRIPEGGDIIKLFSLLLNNGFPEVSFVNEIRENAFLPVLNTTHPIAGLSQPACTSNENHVMIPDAGSPLKITTEDIVSRSSPTPSSSTSIQGIASSAAIPSPIPFVARPRGARSISNDDPALYAVCHLCQNKIMSSRLSNLSNHVRRHASLKQFQCVHCIYTHNEMAKVRLHMQHNHKDTLSQPLDALTPEMQNQWDILMEQCFPGHSKYSSLRVYSDNEGCDVSRLYKSRALLYACIECGEQLGANSLIDHLNRVHKDECVPYCCGECGYQNADQWKVRLHITLKHSEIAAEVSVEVLEAGSCLFMFLHKYFPDIPADEEESRMLSQFQNIAPKEEPQSLSPSVANGTSLLIGAESGNIGVKCEMCQKKMPNYRSLSSLMNHAKRHYHLKQYQCSECQYASSEAAHVRTHMAIKHPQVGAKPIDNNSEVLQNGWIEIMRKCFPVLVAKIDQFRFKHTRIEETKKYEENVEDGNEISGSGKRKKNPFDSLQIKTPKIQNGKRKYDDGSPSVKSSCS